MIVSGNYWLDGVMGVVVGDALGNPVQFMDRAAVARRPQGPVVGMEGGGVFRTPVGTWTDDSSMTLATLSSIKELGRCDLADMMDRFVDWYEHGTYTPFGKAFDVGIICSGAIRKYERYKDVTACGEAQERSNGNGSLMRILPVCLYLYEKGIEDAEAIRVVHAVSALTHAHLRSKIGCGLYYFCVKAVLGGEGTLKERLRRGLGEGFAFYEKNAENLKDLAYYDRLRDLDAFAALPAAEIQSSGYVVHTLEAAIWTILTEETFAATLLKAVNLGNDADTVGAVAGGLAGLYYGYENIPAEWLEVTQRREWIESLCVLSSCKAPSSPQHSPE